MSFTVRFRIAAPDDVDMKSFHLVPNALHMLRVVRAHSDLGLFYAKKALFAGFLTFETQEEAEVFLAELQPFVAEISLEISP